MILEVADIRIAPGRNAEFDVAIKTGLDTVISRSKGFRGYKVNKSVESPERYLLMIYWDTLENHTVDFRQGPLFARYHPWSSISSWSRRRLDRLTPTPPLPHAGGCVPHGQRGNWIIPLRELH